MVTAPAGSPTSQSAGGWAGGGTWRSGNLRGRSAWAIAGLALALFTPGSSCFADTIHVTTWNLETAAVAGRTNAAASTNQTRIQQAAAGSKKQNLESATVAGRTNAVAGTNQIRIRQAAAALKKLNPDVILLQQVRDWQMCDQLAQALKPAEYKVLICSSFRAPRTGTLSKQQVAILAKRTAYFSWSEMWRAQGKATLPGGLAFAALQIGKQRIGFFSVQAGTPPARAADPGQRAANLRAQMASVSQLLEQVGSVTNWVTNRVQVLVVGGTFDPGTQDKLAAQDAPLRLLEEAGFGDAFLGVPAAEKVTRPGKGGQPGTTVDYIFTQPAGCAANPRVPSTTGFVHRPAVCDMELEPAKVIAATATHLEALPTREASRSSQASEVKAEPKPSEAAPIAPPMQRVQPAVPAPAPVPTPTAPAPAFNHYLLTAAVLGGIMAVAAVVWTLARRRRAFSPATPALIADRGDGAGDFPSSYTVVVGTRSATQPAPADTRASPEPRPIIHIETPGMTQTQAEVLRQRALAAEQRAERATAVIRSGLIPHLSHWLKQKLVRGLVTDRRQLLETQQAATQKAVAVEERLARIEQQIQRQNSAYQERIEALTRELIVAKEENRELIRARIAQIKAEMEAARVRMMAQTEAGDGGEA